MPGTVDLAPVSWRRPFFRRHRRPAIRKPKVRPSVTAIAHKREPFAVGHQRARNPRGADEFTMYRTLVVEVKTLLDMPDCADAFRNFGITFCCGGAWWPPV